MRTNDCAPSDLQRLICTAWQNRSAGADIDIIADLDAAVDRNTWRERNKISDYAIMSNITVDVTMKRMPYLRVRSKNGEITDYGTRT